MSRLAAMVTFLLATSAFADEAFDRALADLESDDIAKRQAAEQALMDSGPEAYEPCRKALEKATDEEMKMRLARVVEWLAIETKTGGLEAAWKERWFLVSREGKTIGWGHATGERATVKGRRAWKFESEASLELALGLTSSWKAAWTSLHDIPLTPVTCTLELAKPEGRNAIKLTFGSDDLAVRNLRGRPQKYFDESPNPGRAGYGREGSGPLALDLNLIALVERASLVRQPAASWDVFRLMGYQRPRCFPYEVAFAGEESVEAAGATFRARHYVHEAGGDREREDYWIDDVRGLVKLEAEGVIILLSDEKTVAPMRPDPEAAARVRLDGALKGIAGPADGRDIAEQRLLGLDDRALGRCREALAAAPDEDAKLRLARVCDWLDPEFKLAELEAMWKDAWYVAKEEDYWEGSEHVNATACRVRGKPGWKVESIVRLPKEGRIPPRVKFETRTLRDGPMSPVDMELSITEGATKYRLILRFDPECIEMTLLEVNGRKPGRDEQMSEVLEVAGAKGLPWTASQDVTRLLERASLARLPRLDLHVVEVLSRDGARGKFKAEEKSFLFTGDTETDFEGKPVAVRKYARVADSARREEYLIEDARGVLRAQVKDLNIVRTDKDGAKRPPGDEKK
ncbi:MAG: hypothetical protein HYY18_18465 [Planctomycetes bacterium]|nr:hypothetical protein [Planctomycetota bacterium]